MLSCYEIFENIFSSIISVYFPFSLIGKKEENNLLDIPKYLARHGFSLHAFVFLAGLIWELQYILATGEPSSFLRHSGYNVSVPK